MKPAAANRSMTMSHFAKITEGRPAAASGARWRLTDAMDRLSSCGKIMRDMLRPAQRPQKHV